LAARAPYIREVRVRNAQLREVLAQFQLIESVGIVDRDEIGLQETIKVLSESNLDGIRLFTFDLPDYVWHSNLTPLKDLKARGIKFHERARVKFNLRKSYSGSDLSLLANFSNLEELAFLVPCITNADFETIFKNNKSLTKFSLISYFSLKGFSFLALLVNLEELDVSESGINNADLKMICENIKLLQKINLSRCVLITDFTPLHLLSYLEELNVSELENIIDTDLKAICEKTPLLKKVNLRACRTFTNFTPLSLLSHLEYVDVSGTKITKEVLSKIEKEHPGQK
jgi:hypothetical protein